LEGGRLKTSIDPGQDAQPTPGQSGTIETQHRRLDATKRGSWRYVKFKKLTPDEGLVLIIIAVIATLALVAAIIFRLGK
jgi:hypothetical protein